MSITNHHVGAWPTREHCCHLWGAGEGGKFLVFVDRVKQLFLSIAYAISLKRFVPDATN